MTAIALKTIDAMTKTTDPFRFARELVRRREASGHTQKSLAQEIVRRGGKASVSRFSQLEDTETLLQNGEATKPSPKLLHYICEILEWEEDNARDMLGMRRINAPRDWDAEEFDEALEGYRQLTDEGKEYLKDIIRRTLHFLLDARREAVETEKLTKKKTFRWMPTGEKGEDHDPRDLGIEIHDVDDQGNVIKKKR